MADLLKFLAARLDEDTLAAMDAAKAEPEEVSGHPRWLAKYGTVVDADDDGYAMITESTDTVCAHIARHDPARVLREVEAGRRILKMHRDCGTGFGFCDDGGHGYNDGGCGTLASLATIYSDHPDFDQAWKPSR